MFPEYSLETLVSPTETGADLRAACVGDAEAALMAHESMSPDEESELTACLRPLLALPVEELLRRLLGSDPGENSSATWDWPPPLPAYLE